MDGSYSQTSIEVKTQTAKIDAKKIQLVVRHVCKALKIDRFDLSITFLNAHQIAKINYEFRKLAKPTDVLAFPMNDWLSPLSVASKKKATSYIKGPQLTPHVVLGDIFICVSEACRNANAIGQSVSREVIFLLTHGILHLCGHDHIKQNEEKRMILEQKRLMSQLLEPPLVGRWDHCINHTPHRGCH